MLHWNYLGNLVVQTRGLCESSSTHWQGANPMGLYLTNGGGWINQ